MRWRSLAAACLLVLSLILRLGLAGEIERAVGAAPPADAIAAFLAGDNSALAVCSGDHTAPDPDAPANPAHSHSGECCLAGGCPAPAAVATAALLPPAVPAIALARLAPAGDGAIADASVPLGFRARAPPVAA